MGNSSVNEPLTWFLISFDSYSNHLVPYDLLILSLLCDR